MRVVNRIPGYIKTVIVVLCSMIASYTHGQRPELVFDHYNVEDGLSQSTVWNIFEDSKGFIWFCTPDGLNKFDGYSFKVYRTIKGDRNSIPSNRVLAMFESSDGDLWIGHRGGLSKYHYRQDRFSEVYTLPEGFADGECLLPVHELDGKVWAWSNLVGMIGFNMNTLAAEASYPMPDNSPRKNPSYSRFGKTIDNKAFICTRNSVMVVFDFRSFTYQFLFSDLRETLSATGAVTSKFTIDKNKNLWIPGGEGLIHLNTTTLKYSISNQRFVGQMFTACAFDDQGKLWVGSTSQGIYIIDSASNAVVNILKKSYRDNGLLYNYIESLYKDSSGNMWIGMNGYGIHKFSPYKNKFDHFDLKIGTNSFGGNLVKSVTEDAEGNLFVGAYGNGVYRITKNGEIQNFPIQKNNTATGLAIGPGGDVLAVNDGSLLRLENGKFRQITFAIDLQLKSVTSVISISEREIVVSTDKGLFSLEKINNTYRVKKNWPVNGLLPTILFQDSKKRIWIGTQRSFHLLEKSDGKPVLMNHVTQNFVKSFSEDREGNIWISTLGDLICYNPETGKSLPLNEKHGFVNTFFYAALPAVDGKVWVSSNQGLAMYDPSSGVIKNYTVQDGLQSNEFNTGAFAKLSDGRLAFGGLNGLNVFDPTSIITNPNLPRVVFTNFMVDDKPYQLDTSIVAKKQIDLPYSMNTFSFEFSGLEYTSPENIQYAYRLKGHDKDWVQGGNRRFVRYSRLAPGTYEFNVKASNSDGIWNEQPVSIVVNILPPVYLQSWFILTSILASVLLIALFSIWVVRSRYRAKLRQLEIDHKIQLERGRISRDLHDHVGSQLTFIINQLDDGQGIVMTEQLADARDAARTTMGNLRETIWALHNETITLEDFTDRVKEFAMKQLKSRKNMLLEFNERITSDYTFNPARALNVFRIAQEVINNAIKHSDGNLLSITLEQVADKFTLMINDNGNGFLVSSPGSVNGYGLKNIAYRANEINAELKLTSSAGHGTTVVIRLTLDAPFETTLHSAKYAK